MPAIIICNGCGKQAKMIEGENCHYHKPHSWFERSDEDGILVACSRECVAKISKETGKTGMIMLS